MRKKLILLVSLAALIGILIIIVAINLSFSFFTKSIARGPTTESIGGVTFSPKENDIDKKNVTDVPVKNNEKGEVPVQENVHPQISNKESTDKIKIKEEQEDNKKSDLSDAIALKDDELKDTNKSAQEQVIVPPKDAPKPPPATSNYSATISKDKAEKVQESVTFREKAKIMTMLISKLSSSEIQLFTKMMGNGLSVEEKKEAKKIILNKLSEDEYNELIAIAAKYGLSQGKDYKDSLKEQHIVKNP